MTAPEQGDIIESVDSAIGQLAEWLNDNIGSGNFVLAVTADHAQTPLHAGGWPIGRSEITDDIDRRFDHMDDGTGIIQRTSASSFFANAGEMTKNGVTPEQVATFLTRYTIGDNVADGQSVPKAFEGRMDERIFDAVFPGRALPKVRACSQG